MMIMMKIVVMKMMVRLMMIFTILYNLKFEVRFCVFKHYVHMRTWMVVKQMEVNGSHSIQRHQQIQDTR